MTQSHDDQDIVGVSFKIPRSLRQEMKLWATRREMTLTQVFIQGFKALKEADADAEDQADLFTGSSNKRR